MNILLTGASGFIGRNLSATLTAGGDYVKPICRSVGIDVARMLSVEDWLPHLQGVDAVINSVGIIGENCTQRFDKLHTLAPSALFRACTQSGVRRVIQISALGADETAFSAYHLTKRAADDCLRNLDLDWYVLRPSLIYGNGGKSAEMFMHLAAMPVIPVIGNGQQELQPVHISDVVATAVQCLTSPVSRQTIDIVGTETVTFTEWFQTMRLAQGLPKARFVHIPFRLAMAGAYLGRYFNPLFQPENFRMLQRGYWADFRPLELFLGRLPRRIQPSLFFLDAVSAMEGS